MNGRATTALCFCKVDKPGRRRCGQQECHTGCRNKSQEPGACRRARAERQKGAASQATAVSASVSRIIRTRARSQGIRSGPESRQSIMQRSLLSSHLLRSTPCFMAHARAEVQWLVGVAIGAIHDLQHLIALGETRLARGLVHNRDGDWLDCGDAAPRVSLRRRANLLAPSSQCLSLRSGSPACHYQVRVTRPSLRNQISRARPRTVLNLGRSHRLAEFSPISYRVAGARLNS